MSDRSPESQAPAQAALASFVKWIESPHRRAAFAANPDEEIGKHEELAGIPDNVLVVLKSLSFGELSVLANLNTALVESVGSQETEGGSLGYL
jgi:hypothetical protein